MEERKTLKIISICGFIVFAIVSCWATAESLHLLLPNLPILVCWAVTIGFFVIASWGTKLIIDSLNQNIYMEKRGWHLIAGIIIVLFFWFICSMPTNTHTFFYRGCITDIVTQDLTTTKGYLQQLRDNIKTETEIKSKIDRLESEINAEIIALENEIDNLANPGFGKRAKSHLDKIATTLQVSSIPTLSYTGISPQQIRLLKQQYKNMIYELLKKREEELVANYINPQEKLFKPEAIREIKNIETIEKYVAEMDASNTIDNNLITQADITLRKSYAIIKTYSDFISFKSATDKELYLAHNQVTKVSRMASVIDVWKDYLAGKHEGRGFIYWIIISILVDIAAFVFFDIAFKREE